MTVLVGLLCSDGVVIASDSAATFGPGIGAPTIGQQTVRKVHKLAPKMIYAGTGAVGMGQMVSDKIGRGYGSGAFKGATTPDEMMWKVATAINEVVLPFLQSGQLVHQIVGGAPGSLVKSMVALDVKGEPQLFTFDFNGAPERATPQLPFVSMGSGQAIADPFLAFLHRLFWTATKPTVAEGRLAAIWTIDHVCKTNPGGVGGAVQIMVLPKGGDVIEIGDNEVAEHKQQATGAESALVKFVRAPVAEEAHPPQMPEPPAAQ